MLTEKNMKRIERMDIVMFNKSHTPKLEPSILKTKRDCKNKYHMISLICGI